MTDKITFEEEDAEILRRAREIVEDAYCDTNYLSPAYHILGSASFALDALVNEIIYKDHYALDNSI